MSNVQSYDMQSSWHKSITERFWLEEPASLFKRLSLLPHCGMTDCERLNAMTRLIIVIAVILFIIPLASWWLFLILGIILIVGLYYMSRTPKPNIIENYRCRYRQRHKKPQISGEITAKKPKLNLRTH